jgi:hypothetical protein
VLRRDDDYAAVGKPACDYDDPAAREELVDALARDARALLAALDGQEPEPEVAQAAALLASVTGQDLEQDAAGIFRIARRVAPDRILSTVDPDARHGHKTSARGFDGYKGHIAIDPDAEIITAAETTAGNSGDAEVAERLLADLLPSDQDSAGNGDSSQAGVPAAGQGQPAVYADAAYGSGELLGQLDRAGSYNGIKCQPPAAVKGCFPKDRFAIDLDAQTVTCPAGVTVPIRPATGRHAGAARFGAACRTCPLTAQCTGARDGRTITIGPHEARPATARIRQADPVWKADYRATRPKVERKISHLMRRRHGGRRARVRRLVRPPPTSPCSPPRSTWPAWACSRPPAATAPGPPTAPENWQSPASGLHQPRQRPLPASQNPDTKPRPERPAATCRGPGRVDPACSAKTGHTNRRLTPAT